jgi:colanic acid biosynthesis glycosyl transferase WcaI
MKKALILSPFFSPEPISSGKYNTVFASALIAKDIEVTVYCSHPLYPTWKVEYSHQQISGCRIFRGGGWMRYPKNPILRRLALEIWFSMYCLIKAFKLEKFDVIIPVFPPSLFGIFLPLFRLSGGRIIGIVHDLQDLHTSNSKSWMRRILHFFITFIEKYSFRHCDHLIFLSEAMQKKAGAAYRLGPSKSSVHFPFVTIEIFCNTGALKNIIPDNQISIVYSGALGAKQAPHKILAFYQFVLSKNQQAHCYIFSLGPEFERLKAENENSRIHFHPLVPEEKLPELLLRSTIQLLPQETGTADGSLPSKLPNILASGTKILCITDPEGDLLNLLSRYPFARTSTTWDFSALYRLLQELLVMPSGHAISIAKPLLSKFSANNLVDEIVHIVKQPRM